MRSIAEIKESMTKEFMQNEHAAKLWGFTVGDSWNAVMGRVSVENVLMYVVAVCCHVVESLMATHKKEVEDLIGTLVPHRARWYRDKALAFLDGKELIADSDEYDTDGMSEEDIEVLRVVKYAVAVELENDEDRALTIKVAGEDNNKKRQPLTEEQATRLKAYLNEVKDAGVQINLVNENPDGLSMTATIYYNALYSKDEVKTQCEETVKSHIENLEFNGVLTVNNITDALREIDGVVVVKLGSITISNTERSGIAMNAYCRPKAGYCNVDELDFDMKEYGTYI